MRISASEQVQKWLFALPPQTKHRVRLALRKLSRGEGDIRGLSGGLEGFCRVRVGGLRIVFRQLKRDEIYLEFASARDHVYELFQQILRDKSEG